MEFTSITELDEYVSKCELCPLSVNQKCLPVRTRRAKYLALFESPKPDTVHHEYVWNELAARGFDKEHFLIINTVQCKTSYNKRKKTYNIPPLYSRDRCKPWIMEYINVLKIKKGICFGRIPAETLTGSAKDINERNSQLTELNIGDRIVPVVISVSPESLSFSANVNQERLKQSLDKFRSI